MNQYRMFFEGLWPFKPPHDLQTCTKDLLNMKGFVSKNNQLPTKSHDELEDSSNLVLVIHTKEQFFKT